MISTSLFKKIQKPIVISEKLGIVISNPNVDELEYIQEEIKEELFQSSHYKRRYDNNLIESYDLNTLIKSLYYNGVIENSTTSVNQIINELSNKIICVSLGNFEKTYLQLKNKCIDNPTCEKTIEEKVLNFVSFEDSYSCYNENKKSTRIPIAYNTNYNKFEILEQMWFKANGTSIISRYRFNNHFTEVEFKLKEFTNFGNLIDSYIENEEDFFILDYIIESLSGEEEYTAVTIVKMVSLLEMLIANGKDSLHSELKSKLPQFIPDSISSELSVKENLSSSIYKIRNKIAHGDYFGLQKELEKYKIEFMKTFNFDYYELSSNNWVFSDICIILSHCVANILWTMLNIKPLIKKIKNS